MPYTIKTGYLNVKNENGQYIRNNTVAEQSTAEQIAEIEATSAAQQAAIVAKGNETRQSIPSDYTALSNAVTAEAAAREAADDKLEKCINDIITGQEHVSVEPYNTQAYVDKNSGAINSATNYRIPAGVNSGAKLKIPDGCVKIFFDNWNVTEYSSVAGWATYSTYSGPSTEAFVRGGDTPYINVQPGDLYFSTTLYSPPDNPITEFNITYVYSNAELVTTVRELNDGGLDLKNEVIESQINTWLDEHPEATTTVQDSSITLNKLAPPTIEYFARRAIYDVRDYGVNPNAGSDVYNALFVLVKNIEADGHGGVVYFPSGNYIISDTIFIPENTVFVGEGPSTRIVFNESYTSIGVALSNGGDNCGVMNMTVDCSNSDPIQDGSMTGGIGFSTFDGTTIQTAHPSVNTISRRNTKNLFAINIWTNTRYILQTETEDQYTIDGITYANIFGAKSCVSVQARAPITAVKTDNIECALYRIGFSSYYNNITLQASNIRCGTSLLFGNIQIDNLIVDPSLSYDSMNRNNAIHIKGNVSMSNVHVDGSGKEYLFIRDLGTLRMNNVVGFGATKIIGNNIEATDANWDKLYMSNCSLTQTSSTRNIFGGIASSTDIDYVSTNKLSTIRNRQTEICTPALGENQNISSSGGRASKIEIYDKKIVRVYLGLVLNDPTSICTIPDEYSWIRKANEPFIGTLWNSSANPLVTVPCLCTINGDTGVITVLPASGTVSNYNRFVCDAVYMLD